MKKGKTKLTVVLLSDNKIFERMEQECDGWNIDDIGCLHVYNYVSKDKIYFRTHMIVNKDNWMWCREGEF